MLDSRKRSIAYLYQNPESRDRLSRQAVQRANQLFTWQQITSDVAALYETVISQKSEFRSRGGSAPLHPCTIIDQSFDAAIETYQRSRLVLAPAIVQAANIHPGVFPTASYSTMYPANIVTRASARKYTTTVCG